MASVATGVELEAAFLRQKVKLDIGFGFRLTAERSEEVLDGQSQHVIVRVYPGNQAVHVIGSRVQLDTFYALRDPIA